MRSNSESGFVLLEALVATAVLAAVLGALHGGLRNGWRAWGVAAREDAALSLARSVMAAEGVETALQAGTRSGETGGFTWRTDVARYAAASQGQTPFAGYWVRVDVRWSDRGRGMRERSISLTSLKLASGDRLERR